MRSGSLQYQRTSSLRDISPKLFTRTVIVPFLVIVPGAEIETFTGTLTDIPDPIAGTFPNLSDILASGANWSCRMSEPSIDPLTVPEIAGFPLTVAIT